MVMPYIQIVHNYISMSVVLKIVRSSFESFDFWASTFKAILEGRQFLQL